MATDNPPPHSIEAEQAALGAIFLDPSVLDDMRLILRDPRYFYRNKHQHIFAAMIALHDSGSEIDWVTVKENLSAAGLLAEAGGVEYLQEITEIAPTSLGATHYAEVVRDKAIMRKAVQVAANLRTQAYDQTVNVDEMIQHLESEVMKLSSARLTREMKSVRQILTDVVEQVGRYMAVRSSVGDVVGTPTGFGDFDRMKAGLQPGELVILAGRPGHGKSALALNIADYVSATGKQRGNTGAVMYFSLEMADTELFTRLLSSRAGIDMQDIRRGNITHEQAALLKHHGEEAAVENNLYIDSTYLTTLSEIRSKARRIHRKKRLELIVVDYIQLMHVAVRNDRRDLDIAEISRGLKAFALEIGVPILCLAQLNREVEKRRGAASRPMLSDLRESGALEQDADVVLFIQRPDLVTPTDGPREAVEPADLIMAKNRNGPTGDVRLAFRRSLTRFEQASQDFKNRRTKQVTTELEDHVSAWERRGEE